MKKTRKIALIALFSLSIAILITSIALVVGTTEDANLDKSLLPSPSAVTFYDKNDRILPQNDYATIDEISENVKNAFIAVEDKRFYRHHGIDVKRVFGAAIEDLKTWSFRQGGSTITCQLVKNTHLSNDKTLKRKIKEAKIALQVEREYSKDEILEMYLNVAYFGKGIYGIKNAAITFFGKSTDEITPREAATLAAIVANPSRFSPSEWDNNQARAKMILRLMEAEGYLSKEEYTTAMQQEIVLNYNHFNSNYSRIYINSTLFELKTHLTPNRKLHVYTHFDPTAQAAAEDAINQYPVDKATSSSTEIIVADNDSAGILAFANNHDGKTIKRQPGSLLKPFIYATAIQSGNLIPASPLLDAPITIGTYKPGNYNNTYYGWVDAKCALSKSLNAPAVSTLNNVGIENAVDTLNRSGISLCDKDKNLALALGGTTYGSTTPEICEGYMTLANYGTNKKLSFIRKITDAKGKTLFRREKHESQALPASAAYLTTSMLIECKQFGTAKQLSSLPYEIAAKTGTVAAKSGNSDAWCAAYTTEHTIVCRFSCQSPDTPLPNTVTGGNHPTKTIRKLFKSLYANNTPEEFLKPITVKEIKIDRTIKNEMHLLVPQTELSIGESEKVLTCPTYRFDALNLDDLFFANFKTDTRENGTYVQCQKLANIEYSAYLNGEKCPYTASGFYLEPQFYPVARLDLICKRAGKIVYRKTKIIRVNQSLMSSIESNAAAIKPS